MAVPVNFSSRLIPRQTFCFTAMPGLALCSPPFKRSYQLLQNNTKLEEHGLCIRRQADNKPSNRKRHNLVMSSADDIDLPIGLPSPSASSMIKEFYACINEKKMKELDAYISKGCCFEDCSFPYPIEGKKEIMNFFQQLTAGMGQNVKFIVEHVCEDDELTAGVNWHLEWRQTQIPFTRGCSFFECSEEGDRLVIRKALIVIESPIKPGFIVLALLKNVTTIFDDFPRAAEWLLKSPHVIIQFLLKIYARLLAPIINPVLAGYIRMWNFFARLFALALSALLFFLKKYFG